MAAPDQLIAAGWTRRDGHECDDELRRGGMCTRPGRWYHSDRHLSGRPVCSQHALLREREHQRPDR